MTLIVTGGLKGLQAAVVVAALPFTFILYAMIWAFLGELGAESKAEDEAAYGAWVYTAAEDSAKKFGDPMKKQKTNFSRRSHKN
jgi:choline-glycine betaine transporter